MGWVVCRPVSRLRVSFRGAGGCVVGVYLSTTTQAMAMDKEKAMRSMGPPHAYVCDLLMKLLHSTRFLQPLCSICQSVTNSHAKDLYIFG